MDGEANLKYSTVQSIVETYQPLALERFSKEIDLQLSDTTDCRYIQAYGGHDKEGLPYVKFFPGLLREFSPNAVLFTLCHELGHLFGSVTPKDAGLKKSEFNMQDSLEGEADYFAGFCVLNQLKAEGLAIEAGKEALQKFYGSTVRLDSDLERETEYKKKRGIDPEYPNPNCRLLTIERAVRGEPRPKCWYNPKDNS